MSVIYRAFTGLAAGAVAISAANAAAIDLAAFAGAGGDLSPEQPRTCVCACEQKHQDATVAIEPAEGAEVIESTVLAGASEER